MHSQTKNNNFKIGTMIHIVMHSDFVTGSRIKRPRVSVRKTEPSFFF